MKKDMTQGGEWKVILLFTLPIMGGNFLQQLYNAADGIVVGNFVGGTALSAVGTCGPMTVLFLAFAIGLGVGAGVAVAQYFGAKQHKDMEEAICTAIIFMGAVGAAFSVIGILVSPFLLDTVLNVPENILPLAESYFKIYCIGLFFQFIYNCLASIMRSLGDSKAMFIFLAVTSGANIALDLLFVAVFKWGVAGAAAATVISQGACAVVSYIYLRRKLTDVKIALEFSVSKCLLILKLGVPLSIQQSIISFGILAMQRLVNGFGQTSIEGFTAGTRIDQFVFVPCFGFQAGLSAFVGQNIGAGKLDRAKRGLIETMKMSMVMSVFICVLLFATARPVAGLFGLADESLERAVEQIRFLSYFFIIFAVFTSLSGFLQGAGDVMILSFSSALSLFVRVALSYAGVYMGWLGYSAGWVTLPVGWIIALIIMWVRYLSGKWRFKAVAGGDQPNPAA
ncbi:MAG: MATE family efflux transporter [Oscillospiraceae bacterium]